MSRLDHTNTAQSTYTLILSNRAIQNFLMSSTSEAPMGPAERSTSTFHVSSKPTTAVSQVDYSDGASRQIRQGVASSSAYHPAGSLQQDHGHAPNEDAGSQVSYMGLDSSMSTTSEVDHELAGLDALEDGRPGERPAYPFTTLIRHVNLGSQHVFEILTRFVPIGMQLKVPRKNAYCWKISTMQFRSVSF